MAEYLIPKSAVIFEEEIKKSRFITYLQRTTGIAEAKAFLEEIKREHRAARHHCWAAANHQVRRVNQCLVFFKVVILVKLAL